MKTGPDALGTAENESGAQNRKTGPDALGTAENESERAKHENDTRRPRYRRKRVPEHKTLKWKPTPSIPPKMSTGAQNMITGPDALVTAENMKTGPNALGTAENESGRGKFENGTRGTRHRRK
jgi:hypothetical protein